MENTNETKQKPPHSGPYVIIGPTTFLAESTCTYNIVPDNGAKYYWEVAGGIITSGQGTDTIVIAWNDTNGVVTANVISDIVVLDTSVGGKYGDEEK